MLKEIIRLAFSGWPKQRSIPSLHVSACNK